MITLDELKDKLADKARLIGLDLGSKRIGVAICDDERKIATPFKTIEYRNMDYLLSELKVIIKENDIFAIIVGNPINMDGSFGKSAQSINDKAKIIGRELNVMIAMWDEGYQPQVLLIYQIIWTLNFHIEKNIDEKQLHLYFKELSISK